MRSIIPERKTASFGSQRAARSASGLEQHESRTSALPLRSPRPVFPYSEFLIPNSGYLCLHDSARPISFRYSLSLEIRKESDTGWSPYCRRRRSRTTDKSVASHLESTHGQRGPKGSHPSHYFLTP